MSKLEPLVKALSHLVKALCVGGLKHSCGFS